MVKKLQPEIGKVYFINKYTLVHILEGQGQIQVDFKNYDNWSDKAIYLENGQYIKFLSDDFVVRLIEFPDDILFKSKDVRILFKHLISLGYINFSDCEDCRVFLDNTVFNNNLDSLLDISTRQWYWQNPFRANREEYQVIFDLKEIIDAEYTSRIDAQALADHLHNTHYDVQKLIKNKLGISISRMLSEKQLVESQKEVAFTDKNMQEIAFSNGYNDPAYFNRLFKNKIGFSPKRFREEFDYQNREHFTEELLDLIRRFHKEQHQLAFYADQMHLSVKALSKKVKLKMNNTLGQLIRSQIINSAKLMLREYQNVKDVAFALGFEEANHFSSFFAKYTGQTPSEFRN